jgi:hypothetical protein
LVEAVKHYKELHSFATKLAVNATLTPIQWTKADKSGIPLALKRVAPLLTSSDPQRQRFGLSITRSFECLYGRTKLDTDAITGPGVDPTQVSWFEDYSTFLETWCKKLPFPRDDVSRKLVTDKVMGAMVSGPNGPAIMTSHYDARAMSEDQEAYGALKEFCKLTDNQWIPHYVENLKDFKHARDQQFTHSRISLIPEGGLKTRTIAIPDYFTQIALRPLHNLLMGCLKGLETDGTYDQDQSFMRLLGVSTRTDQDLSIHCTDLTNATDRAPIFLQELLLSKLVGAQLASAWRNLMTHRRFSVPNHPGEYVKWNVGQPLGLLSSWATFALWHHSLVEYAAATIGRKPFRDYCVLGDDVAIWNTEVATKYESLLSQLAMPINKSKSLVSHGQPSFGEFAKRTFRAGVEISGLKPRIVKGAKTPEGYLCLLNFTRNRNWNLREGAYFPEVSWFSHQDTLLIYHYGYFKGWTTEPPKRVAEDFLPTTQELVTEVNKARIAAVYDKLSLSEKMIQGGTKFFRKLFRTGGVAVDPKLLEYEWTDPYQTHPLVFHYYLTVDQLRELGSELDVLGDKDDLPEFIDIEYLPLPSKGSYYGDKQELKAKLESSLVEAAWQTVLKRKRDEILTTQSVE